MKPLRSPDATPMVEAVGFEPTKPLGFICFQDRCNKPDSATLPLDAPLGFEPRTYEPKSHDLPVNLRGIN